MADGTIPPVKGLTVTEFSSPAPDIGFLSRTRIAPPALPLELFGPWWGPWIAKAAAGANAPPDYTALPLLTAVSALIGNARWAHAWHDWKEPPALWGASVGNPSSGKSPGATPVMRDVLPMVELHMARDYAGELAQWRELKEVSDTIEKQWKKDLAAAVRDGADKPAKPQAADCPPEPVRPRVKVADATIEALANLYVGLPKGLLHVRDELAGWLLNLGRYSGGTDRPFWLEAFVGGPYTVDRLKNPVPIYIRRLAVATFGTIQPERLEECLAGQDDGLAGRFLWTWPEPLPFRRPVQSHDRDGAAQRLQRLAELELVQGDDGERHPAYKSLDPAASAEMERFGQAMQARELAATGLLKHTIGKARGHALRLALVLEYLWWSAERETPEPAVVSCRAMEAAVAIMNGYFLPMAARVFGDAAVPIEERNARLLAQWIVRERPQLVNVSAIRDRARLTGLRETEPVKQAVRYLEEAGWLHPVNELGRPGRPRGDWTVDPRVWEVVL